MPVMSKKVLPLALLAFAATSINAQSDDVETPSGAIGHTSNSVWYGTGSQSVIWVSSSSPSSSSPVLKLGGNSMLIFLIFANSILGTMDV